MVSIGQNNTLAGSRIRASVDGQKLFGKQLYSFIKVKTTDELRGTRWIRVGQFDIEIDKVDEIHLGPFRAIILNMFH